MSKYLKLSVSFKAPFGMVHCLVSIKKEYAITTFKSLRHAREFYANEKEGGADIKLVEEKKSIIQKYEGKTKEEISKIIQAELKKAGGKCITRKLKLNKKVAG